VIENMAIWNHNKIYLANCGAGYLCNTPKKIFL